LEEIKRKRLEELKKQQINKQQQIQQENYKKEEQINSYLERILTSEASERCKYIYFII
jgi:DNA-binding TFAR19-related protein (PDSD5 family)